MKPVERLCIPALAAAVFACRAPGGPDGDAFGPGRRPGEVADDAAVASLSPAAELEVLAVHTVVRAPEHDRLEALVGRFRAEGVFYPHPGARPRIVCGELETWWDGVGATLRGRFDGELWGHAIEFVSEISFDPLLGCWVETWKDLEGSVLRPLAHGYEEAEGLVVTTRWEGGRRVRDEIRLAGDEIARRVWRTSADGVEYLTLELTCRRIDDI